MCGILGIISIKNQIDEQEFNVARDSMFHRGPDGFGTEILGNKKIALGHRRLSIIDLSETGKQPMCNKNQTIWLTFNGEIYNYKDLKEELIKLGSVFKSNSDSEVLIHGFEIWGFDELLSKIKGMFAFAIYSMREQKIYLARDRFGIKPLVYSFQNGMFLFSSELKAITKFSDFKKELDNEALADYFTYGYVPYPKTIWKNSYKLSPASALILDCNNLKFTIKKYWNLTIDNKIISQKEAVEKTQDLVYNATKEHLVSDVPVGLFLSGGYDSSYLLTNIHDLGYKTSTFTIGFKNHEQSEHFQSSQLADYFKTEHQLEFLDNNIDVFSLLNKMYSFYDEPFAISSMLNTYLISKLATKKVKVALSGEGADEVFAGYKWHKKIHNYYTKELLKNKVKNIIKGNFNSKETFLNLYNRSMTGVREETLKSNIVSNELKNLIQTRGLWHFEELYRKNVNPVKNAQYIDTFSFVTDHCLYRGDISSMANSLEVRVPFLDHKIYEFIFSLHPSVYFNKNRKKVLIEENIKNRIPKSVLEMPKRGFSFHFLDHIFDGRAEQLLKNGKVKSLGIIKEDNFNQCSAQMKFHLLNLEFWLQKYY